MAVAVPRIIGAGKYCTAGGRASYARTDEGTKNGTGPSSCFSQNLRSAEMSADLDAISSAFSPRVLFALLSPMCLLTSTLVCTGFMSVVPN
jgi:hypothetical protein